ncbi:hypothetical protein [Acaryochloris sp. IP29b_bin.148]|uniref:hypothetical protein n=1 Tax=Acaryochloris sp. IP29b_bin.148 TaxID=2969218 RepID=UPI0026246098|nr:hypothetical protein [Acaryochloris sp. IP29b_bin.148]
MLIVPLAASTAVDAQAQSQQGVVQPLRLAQEAVRTDPYFLTRAKNLARQAAERENGGLSKYRAEATMYGPAVDSSYVENEDGSVTFSFKGGPPGFTTPTLETVATVAPTGTVAIGYNGPIRPAGAEAAEPASTEPTPTATDPVPEVPSPIIDQIKDLVE